MKKDSFLYSIKSFACIEGSKWDIAWKAAVKIDEKDHRWEWVDEMYPLESFVKAFGIKLPEQGIAAKIQKLERQLKQRRIGMERAKSPAAKESYEKLIASIEEELATLRAQ